LDHFDVSLVAFRVAGNQREKLGITRLRDK
jgi:hypothetical protein